MSPSKTITGFLVLHVQKGSEVMSGLNSQAFPVVQIEPYLDFVNMLEETLTKRVRQVSV